MIAEAVTPRHPQQLRGLLQPVASRPSNFQSIWAATTGRLTSLPIRCLVEMLPPAQHPPLLHSHHTRSTETLFAELTQNCFGDGLATSQGFEDSHSPTQSPLSLRVLYVEKQHEESVHKHPTLTKTPHIQLFCCHKPAWKCKCSHNVDS